MSDSLDDRSKKAEEYWEERCHEPIKATILTEEEIEELRKEGRI